MKRFVKVSLMLATMAVMLSSCNCFHGMMGRMGDIKVTSTPQVLSLKGSTVNADIKVEFPARYFDRKAVLKITPVLVCADRTEFVGTPKFLQGERVRDNYTVISRRNGGSYMQTVSFPFDPRMRQSTLELRVEAKCSSGPRVRREFSTIGAIPVAQGVSTIQLMADFTASMSIMPDNFKRVTTISEEAEIMYLINKSNVRPTELTKEQIKMFEDFVKQNSNRDRTELGNVYAKGFASPDGPVDFNDQLSKDRSETGKDAMSKALASVKPTFDVAAYGEDWDGFKALVQASNIKDKDLILQVLNMYSNPVKRDQEIRNMSAVFEVLKTDILPQLRRTKLIANADVTGRTDAEIKAAAASNINVLTEEEMLFSATLFDDNASKARSYQAAASKFNSARAYNNLGVVLARQGKIAEAQTAINKAATLSNDPAISNNLGALALINGDVAAARRYISPLNTADARANMGLIALAEGDYAQAARSLTGYNAAVAEVLNGNNSRARQLLANESSAQASYLKAIIEMREGNSVAAITNLRAAIAKDPSMKEKSMTDVEFARIYNNVEFTSI